MNEGRSVLVSDTMPVEFVVLSGLFDTDSLFGWGS
jgi:hypothetical protein